ncbi:MAG: hypothetical protein ACR2L2_07835 [Acidobacteriota bacterium]
MATDRKIRIELLTEPAQFRQCVRLQKMIWGRNYEDIVPLSMFLVANRNGGITLGALTRKGEVAGFVFGIPGLDESGVIHWSEMLGVRKEYWGRDFGYQLKVQQREQALRMGIRMIHWTFDPLQSKNAYLNFFRLGGYTRTYEPNFYGASKSPLHRGLDTDRFVVTWPINSQRVRDRLSAVDEGRPAAVFHQDVPPALSARVPARGPVRPGETLLDLQTERIKVEVPFDIVKLKSSSLPVAREWQKKVRLIFQYYFARGYTVVDFYKAKDRYPTGFYILQKHFSAVV